MAGDTHSTIAAALDALDVAVDAVTALSWEALSPRQLISALSRLEVASRRMPVASQSMIARLVREASASDLDGQSVRQALANELMISSGDATRRCEDAMALATRVGLTGEVLEPLLPHAAAAQARGELGREQVALIRTVMGKLPNDTSPGMAADAEAQLARYGSQFRPEVLGKIGRRILDSINPDGELDDRDRARRRGLSIGAQGTDGMSPIRGWMTPELRATFDAVLSKLAAPGMCNPDDESPCVSGTPTETQIQGDGRSAAQRNHDALLAVSRSTLMSGELGQHHGLPVSVVVSTTLQDLEAAAGHGLTAGGTLLPMSDVIRMAGHAHHYLYIFDKASGQSLNLFRTRRCATAAQRIVLHAKDRGCTHPGCTTPAYLCEAHHADADFADGGNTNVDDLALACRPHHRLIKPGGWSTRKRNGRTEWIPPPDTGGQDRRPRSNDYHHPERLLGQDD